MGYRLRVSRVNFDYMYLGRYINLLNNVEVLLLLGAKFLCFVFRNSTRAKIVYSDKGSICIVGSFKRGTVDPDFKVTYLNV